MFLDSEDVYMKTVERLEPALHAVDRDASLASIAISLKRIADSFDQLSAVVDPMKPVLAAVAEKLYEEGSIKRPE